YYEKNIKDRLLYLPANHGRQAVGMFLFVYWLNLHYEMLVKNVSGTRISELEPQPKAFVITVYLVTHRKIHQLIGEIGNHGQGYLTQYVNALLSNRDPPDFQPILEKLHRTEEVMDIAQEEYVKTMHPSGSTNGDK